MNSSKERTNEFVFTSMQRVFIRFLEEIEDARQAFRNYLTFRNKGNNLCKRERCDWLSSRWKFNDWFSKRAKGQLILKCLFGGFNFFQKTNENTSHTSKNEFIRSFFGRIRGLTVCFPNHLTFIKQLIFRPSYSPSIS